MTKWHRDFGWEKELAAQLGDHWRGELPKAYVSGQLNALLSRDEIAEGDMRWHISVSRLDRVPKWDELVQAAHDLRPGVVFVVPMPPRSWWINVHPNALHLWEVSDQALIDQWRAERMAQTPTSGGVVTR